MQNWRFSRWFNGWNTCDLIDDLMAEKWMEINAKNHWVWAQNWMQLNEPSFLIRCKNPEISNYSNKLRRFLNWKREPCSSIVIPEMIFFGGKRLPCHTWNARKCICDKRLPCCNSHVNFLWFLIIALADAC